MSQLQLDKLTVATMQLNTSIRLFFEDRDPVSTHTLVCASLEIFQNFIKSKLEVIDNALVLHPDAVFIKDDYKQLYRKAISKNKNFFKHANRDRDDITKFNSKINELYLFEAIRTFKIVKKADMNLSVEMKTFEMWFVINNEDCFTEEYKKEIQKLLSLYSFDKSYMYNLDKVIFLESIKAAYKDVKY